MARDFSTTSKQISAVARNTQIYQLLKFELDLVDWKKSAKGNWSVIKREWKGV